METITKIPESEKELLIIDDSVLFNSSEELSTSSGPSYSIRLDKDSYIWLFTGRRGGGKSVSMSFFIMRCVAIYNMRVIANYNLEFILRRHRPDGKTYLQHIKSEKLDFEKLLLQNDDYSHVIIAIDESPDIISHMAAQSWKNRLVNAFVRQLRHNFNSLFLVAQDASLIDKSMRWQVDVETQCSDVSRTIGDNSGLERGEMLSLKFFDQSGQWTGETTEDRINHAKYLGDYEDIWVDKMDLFPRFMFGDDTHKAVFDSWQDINILESLKKVDLKLETISIGSGNEENNNLVLENAFGRIEDSVNNRTKLFHNDLYNGLKPGEKQLIGSHLRKAGAEIKWDHGQRYWDTTKLDMSNFLTFPS